MKRLQLLWSQRKGNAIVEFALSFPILFISLVGTFQFGYTFYTYNALQSSVRAGARYASLRSYDSSTSTPSAAFLAAVRNVVVYGSPSGGTKPVVAGLTTDKVSLSVTLVNNVPSQMTVSINSFDIDAAVGKIRLTGKPWTAFPYTGRQAR